MVKCSKCQQHKEKSEFYKDKTRKHGVRPYCKECKNGVYRQYYISKKLKETCEDGQKEDSRCVQNS